MLHALCSHRYHISNENIATKEYKYNKSASRREGKRSLVKETRQPGRPTHAWNSSRESMIRSTTARSLKPGSLIAGIPGLPRDGGRLLPDMVGKEYVRVESSLLKIYFAHVYTQPM